MRFFLVDYENVNSWGLTGIEDLNSDDRVIIFYGPNSNTISLAVMEKIREKNINIELHELKQPSPNAIDFQISAYLGYLVAKENDAAFYVISKDKGYAASIDFCKGNLMDYGKIIEKYDSIVTAINADPSFSIEISVLKSNANNHGCNRKKIITEKNYIDNDSIVRQRVLNLMSPIKSEFSNDEKDEICDIITDYIISSSNKEEFHNNLVKRYKVDLGSKYYKLIKSEYTKLKAL